MLDIVALVASFDARAQIVTSIGRRARVKMVSSPRELADVVASSWPSAVICEFSNQAGAGTAAVVRDLRARRPALPVIGYCRADAQASRHLLIAARAGVSALALRGLDDVGTMLDQVLAEAEGGCVAEEVSRALAGRVSPLVLDVVELCIRHARDLPDVAKVAAALHLSRRTLSYRLRREGSPSIAALISWSRLFIAAELLGHEARSVEQPALALGFASGSALRRMLRRYADVTPRQLREQGGLRHLIACFLREVEGTTTSDR